MSTLNINSNNGDSTKNNLFASSFKSDVLNMEELKNILINKDLNFIKDYISNHEIQLQTLNIKNKFDILIYTLEHDTSIDIIQYLLQTVPYSSIDYTIVDKGATKTTKNPIYVAFSKNNYNIIHLFFQKYKLNVENITEQLFQSNIIQQKHLKFLINHGLTLEMINKKNIILNILKLPIYSIQKLNMIFKQFIYDNTFILQMLDHYKEKKAISYQSFREEIRKEKEKIKLKEEHYQYAQKIQNTSLLKCLFDYDGSPENVMIDRIYHYDLLNIAVKSNKPNFVKQIVSYPVFKFQTLVSETLLKKASEQNNIEILKILIKAALKVTPTSSTTKETLISELKTIQKNDNNNFIDNNDRKGNTSADSIIEIHKNNNNCRKKLLIPKTVNNGEGGNKKSTPTFGSFHKMNTKKVIQNEPLKIENMPTNSFGNFGGFSFGNSKNSCGPLSTKSNPISGIVSNLNDQKGFSFNTVSSRSTYISINESSKKHSSASISYYTAVPSPSQLKWLSFSNLNDKNLENRNSENWKGTSFDNLHNNKLDICNTNTDEIQSFDEHNNEENSDHSENNNINTTNDENNTNEMVNDNKNLIENSEIIPLTNQDCNENVNDVTKINENDNNKNDEKNGNPSNQSKINSLNKINESKEIFYSLPIISPISLNEVISNNIHVPKYESQYLITIVNRSIRIGYLPLVEYLFQGNEFPNFSIDTPDINGHYPMIVAIQAHQPDIFEFIFKNTLHFTVKQINGNSLLTLAIHHQQPKIVQCLLENEMETIMKKDANNTYPIIKAIEQNNFEIVHLLVTYGQRYNLLTNILDGNGNTPLTLAYRKGYYQIFHYLVHYFDINQPDKYSQTVMNYAILMNDFQTVQYLLDLDIEVTMTVNKNGETLLDQAIAKGNKDIILILLPYFYFNPQFKSTGVSEEGKEENNHEPDSKNEESLIIRVIKMMNCSEDDKVEILHYLIERGWNVNTLDINEIYSPLIYAINRKLLKVVQLLVQNNANVNINLEYRNENISDEIIEKSPLWIAIEQDADKIVKYLIESGADLRFVHQNRSIWQEALRQGNSDIIECLAQHNIQGLKLNDFNDILDYNGQKLEEMKENQIIEILIHYGWDINSENEQGYTLLYRIILNSNKEFAQYLIQNGAILALINKHGQSLLECYQDTFNESPYKYTRKKGNTPHFKTNK